MLTHDHTNAPVDLDVTQVFSVRDRIAVVTGASSGLGYRFTQVLAANGARVLAVARRGDRLTELAETMGGIDYLQADLLDPTAAERIVTTVMAKYGRIDVLINNAGVGDPCAALDESAEQFRRVLDLNLVALFELSCQTAKHMLEVGSGSIINVASILGLVASMPIPNASYAASKGAVVNLTRELACQWARGGIRVNAIAPGWFPSEMTVDLSPEFVKKNCPMGRMGLTGELDGVLLFLASDASSYCTGQVLTIDGGWTAR